MERILMRGTDRPPTKSLPALGPLRRIRRAITTLIATTFLGTACTQPPERVSAANVDPAQYASLGCGELSEEWVRISRKLNEAEERQRRQVEEEAKQSTNRGSISGYDIILLPVAVPMYLALFPLTPQGKIAALGQRMNAELSELKGRYAAVEQAARTQHCPIPSVPSAPPAELGTRSNPPNMNTAATIPDGAKPRHQEDRPQPDGCAIADYDQAIRRNPNLADAFYTRGNTYHDRGQYDCAIWDYDQAVNLDPGFARAYARRGQAYLATGQRSQANADFARARRIDPNQVPEP